MPYKEILDKICPDRKWLNKLKLGKGKEEANAILDILVELCSGDDEIKIELAKGMVESMKKMIVKNQSEKLIQLWDTVKESVGEIGKVCEYDPETNRMILISKKTSEIKL